MSRFGFIGIFLIILSFLSITQCKQAIQAKQSFTINSKILSEKVSITTYGFSPNDKNKAIVYITDGQKMIKNGTLKIIKKFTENGKIPNAYYVFISTIDAETNEDKRTTYFFCNNEYIRFFEEELVPRIEGSFSQKTNAKNRSLVGVSFGGLNAAYFSGKTTLFQNYGLLSPITYPCDNALSAIAFTENKDLTIFISTGKNDAENYVKPLTQLYKSKNYNVHAVFTQGAHDFENWNSQLENLFNFLNTTTQIV